MASSDAKVEDSNGSDTSLIIYTCWHCPYAARVGISLDLKKIPYTKVEIDPYNKSKEWLSKNPRGKVPTIEHEGHFVYESSMILEYLDIAYCDNSPLLFSKTNAYQHWNDKIWIDFINKNIGEQYYYLNNKQNISSYFENISKYIKAMDETGPFFNGNQCMAVDIAFIPWAMRMDNVEKKLNGTIKAYFNDKIFHRYSVWWDACQALDAVTNNDPNRLKKQAFQ